MYALERAISTWTRRSAVFPSQLRRHWPVKLRSGLQIIVCTKRAFENFGSRCRCAKLRRSALEKRRSQCDVLRPADCTISVRRVYDRFPNYEGVVTQDDAPAELEACYRQPRTCDEHLAGDTQGVGRNRSLTVRRQTGQRFLFGGRSEDIEAQIVTHDAGEQAGIGARAVGHVVRAIECRRLDRRPRWRPQGIHGRGLVEDLSNVAALLQQGDPQPAVLENCGSASAITHVGQSFSLRIFSSSDTSIRPWRQKHSRVGAGRRTQSMPEPEFFDSNRVGFLEPLWFPGAD